MKQSLQARIRSFHDGTAAIEELFDADVVPLALRPDVASFQKDRDQIEWFRQMEAIEVQELGLRFLQAPDHAAFHETKSSEVQQQIHDAPESAISEQDDPAAVPGSLKAPGMPGQTQSAEEDADHDMEANLAATMHPADEAEDPQALGTWLREIVPRLKNPDPTSSIEFARWAIEGRDRARVSRNRVVMTLMALRDSGGLASQSTASTLAGTWSQLETRVLKHNVRAALFWANRHRGPLPNGLAFILALVGMRRAARAFEPSRGYKFLTYAGWWMRQAVQRGRVDFGTALRIPAHVSEALSLLKRVTSGCPPSAAQALSNSQILTAMAEISERVLPLGYLERLRHLDRRQRLSDLVDPGEPVLPIDHLFEESRWPPIEVATDENHPGRLAIAADALIEAVKHEIAKSKPSRKERNHAVAYGRLGLDGQHSRPTLEQLGERFGITRERIRQVEMKVFAGICKTLGIPTESCDD